MQQKARCAVAVLLGTIIGVSLAAAAPIEFDTGDAHVIVVRAVDRWSPDRATSEATLEQVKKRTKRFTLIDENGGMQHGAGQAVFSFGEPTNPIVKAVEAELKILGAIPSTRIADTTYIQAPAQLKADEMPLFLQAQRSLFKAMVANNGNPATLEDRVKSRKILGGIAAAAVTLLAMDKLGMGNGSQFAIGSGITDETDRSVRRFGLVAGPIPLPELDFNGYKSIDVRKAVTPQGDRVGQILIAYRAAKTPEAETAALSKAIVTMLALGTPVEEIEAARATDLAARQATWDACVAEGKCSSQD